MKYSLSTAALFAIALGTNLVYASPLIKARDSTDEIKADAPLWFYDIRNITQFIETASTLNASALQAAAESALYYWSDEHAREVQINQDLKNLNNGAAPGNGVPDEEFNRVWQGVNEAFTRMWNSGNHSQTADPNDIVAALNGLCGPSWYGAREILNAAGELLNTTFTINPPSNCNSRTSSPTTAATTSTTQAASSTTHPASSTTQPASSTSSTAAATTSSPPIFECKQI